MEKIVKSKGFHMVLSVLIAIGLWMYVGRVENPDVPDTIRNLPITFVGTDILENRGLMIYQGGEQTVTIRVTGKRNVVNLLSAETVSIMVDVSTIEQPGQYTLSYQVFFNLPGTNSSSSLVVTDRSPQNLVFTVARQAQRKIPIRGSTNVNVAEGYQAGAFSFLPDTIEVRGEESLVNQIEYAQVILEQTELSATFSGDLPYTLIGYNGDTIDREKLITNASFIRTTLPIYQIKEVPLTVNILPGGGANQQNIKYEIEPKSIMVSGSANDLEPLKEISLGEIDLSKIMESETLTFSIPLAPELNNVSGVSEATVSITIKGLTTATLEVDNIEFIHVPIGYIPRKVTQTRQVQIRGTAEAVAAVSASQLRIVADLDQAVATTGTQTIPVKVYLDSAGDVGVVGDYNIVVSITRQ